MGQNSRTGNRGRNTGRKRRKSSVKRIVRILLSLAIILATSYGAYVKIGNESFGTRVSYTNVESAVSVSEVPAYSASPFVVINSGKPVFSSDELTATSYEKYSDLDRLGRCQAAIASVGKDLMPNEERGSIGMIRPTGWHLVKYDNVDGKYLYNRCHLIGYQLTGENANKKNLITGTRYLNTEGMLPFENEIGDYVRKTGNHVVYRVTPIFDGDNMLASGVQMEAKSVEDNGKGVQFNVYCYNVQPGIVIDYINGDSTSSQS